MGKFLILRSNNSNSKNNSVLNPVINLITVELTPKQIPQIIMITFDDAVNDVNWHIYEEIFTADRKNPNGCPIRATFYVSHEWTDYGQVQTLYSRGHEIASHSIT